MTRRTLRRSDTAAAVMDVLEAAGIDDYRAEIGGKHVKIRWWQGGRKMTICTSLTPSDHRSALNVRAHTKRMLRSTG
jgi:hypothetical protein